METNTALTIVPARPDAEVAADLKRRLTAALGPVLNVVNEARAAGFVPTFQLDNDHLGRTKVAEVSMARFF